MIQHITNRKTDLIIAIYFCHATYRKQFIPKPKRKNGKEYDKKMLLEKCNYIHYKNRYCSLFFAAEVSVYTSLIM